jgi:hypothetical protein
MRMKKAGKVFVTVPISEPASRRLREEAATYGQSATALMTSLLEHAAAAPTIGDPPMAVRSTTCGIASASGRSAARETLYRAFVKRLIVNPALNRKLVSFQANRDAPFYRWLKYKEAFSSELIDYLLDVFYPRSEGVHLSMLDPFAGAGTALTVACRRGWKATGIELLPIGIHAIRARFTADRVDLRSFQEELKRIESHFPENIGSQHAFPHLRITQDAFSAETETAMSAYQIFLETIQNEETRYLFWFACLAVLEDVSFTRKDGQYLRWDQRSGRRLAHAFHKGRVPAFREAILEKLHQIDADLRRRNGGSFAGNARLIHGSCLAEMAKLPSASFDLIVTSPPYCNRYDYTRTYALELAFMGCGEDELKALRQTLLSATVENKSKRDALRDFYDKIPHRDLFTRVEKAFDQQAALQEVLALLCEARDRGELSNNNIPDLVGNYFLEMTLIVFESARVLKAGGRVLMVNDNVRYHGEEVPVDLILSDLAETAGFHVEKIWVLPRGKGNSSQQMGRWGRQEMRKCIYCWVKTEK